MNNNIEKPIIPSKLTAKLFGISETTFNQIMTGKYLYNEKGCEVVEDRVKELNKMIREFEKKIKKDTLKYFKKR